MKCVHRNLSSWKALIAAAVICASSGSARADLYLTVSDSFTGPTVIDVTTTAGPYSFDGYSLNLSGSTSVVPPATSLTLSGTVTNVSNASPFDVLNLSLSTSAPSSGFFSGPSGAAATLTSTLTITAIGTGGTTITEQGVYTPYGGSAVNGFVTGRSSTGTSTSPGKGVTLSSTYDLSANSVDISSLTLGQAVTFSGKATVALPEPSGVIAAFAGLPCMGVLLGFARRVRSRVGSAIALA